MVVVERLGVVYPAEDESNVPPVGASYHSNVGEPAPLVATNEVEFPIQTLNEPLTTGNAGGAFLRITTVSLEDWQAPFEMVQTRVAFPIANPLTAEVGLPGVTIFAVPDATVQRPVPTLGALPSKVVTESHNAWSGPAMAVVGIPSRVITTSSVDAVHPPLVMVQRKVFEPIPNPETPEAGFVALVIVPEPPTNDHIPVPTEGEFPASVAVVAQTFWSGPALAVVGCG